MRQDARRFWAHTVVFLCPFVRPVLRESALWARAAPGAALRRAASGGSAISGLPLGPHLLHALPVRHQEEAHGAPIHEVGELPGGNDRVDDVVSPERDHGLVGVQDDRGRAHGVGGYNQVLGAALVGLQVLYQCEVCVPAGTARTTTWRSATRGTPSPRRRTSSRRGTSAGTPWRPESLRRSRTGRGQKSGGPLPCGVSGPG